MATTYVIHSDPGLPSERPPWRKWLIKFHLKEAMRDVNQAQRDGKIKSFLSSTYVRVLSGRRPDMKLLRLALVEKKGKRETNREVKGGKCILLGGVNTS